MATFFSLNSVAFTAPIYTNKGYQDETANFVNAFVGDTIPFEVAGFKMNSNAISYSHYLSIFIDANHNGDFTDEGEQLYSGERLIVHDSHFVVPANASGSCRLRVIHSDIRLPQGGCGTIIWGEVRDFTLLVFSQSQLIITRDITNTTPYSANCGGIISPKGIDGISQRGVVWSLSANPTLGTNESGHTTDGNANTAFTSSLTGLAPGTTYYVRSYASNTARTIYGNEISFTTPSLYFPTNAIDACPNAYIQLPEPILCNPNEGSSYSYEWTSEVPIINPNSISPWVNSTPEGETTFKLRVTESPSGRVFNGTYYINTVAELPIFQTSLVYFFGLTDGSVDLNSLIHTSNPAAMDVVYSWADAYGSFIGSAPRSTSVSYELPDESSLVHLKVRQSNATCSSDDVDVYLFIYKRQ